MVEHSSALEASSMLGVNRNKAFIEAIDFEPNKFEKEEVSKAESREMGAKLYPSKIASVGDKLANSEASASPVDLPEIGKGSITNSIV